MSVKTTACTALGEMGRNAPLPIDDGKDESESNSSEGTEGQNGNEETNDESASPDEKKQRKEVITKEKNVTKLSLVNTLIAMIKTSNEANKVNFLQMSYMHFFFQQYMLL